MLVQPQRATKYLSPSLPSLPQNRLNSYTPMCGPHRFILSMDSSIMSFLLTTILTTFGFIPYKTKSDVLPVFTRFKTLVEKKFQTQIITLYSDNGGEYIAMKDFLASNGITHLTSPPHTRQHNGFAERRHRHLVETGLALLSHASIPISYWSYALTAAAYLINRLPTSTLSNSSPFELLNLSPPNYTTLRVFGCLCYPWLRPYTNHKLDPRSTPCIFLGYSQTQSAYLYLDPSSIKIFISRHVQFLETDFPYKTLKSSSPSVSSSSSTLWFPPILTSSGHSNSPSSAVHLPPGSGPSQAQQQEPVAPPSAPVNSSPTTSGSDTQCPDSSSAFLPTPSNIHPMVTRSKNHISRPNPKFAMLASSDLETEPTSIAQALNDEKWRRAMGSEYDAQIKHQTWDLVPPDPSQKLVGTRWFIASKDFQMATSSTNPDLSQKVVISVLASTTKKPLV